MEVKSPWKSLDLFDAESFLIFLQILLHDRKRGKIVLLILDNAGYHHYEELYPWLHANRKRSELFFPPPYSPELNPIERVWKLTRKHCTHNQYFETIEDIKNVVDEQFKI